MRADAGGRDAGRVAGLDGAGAGGATDGGRFKFLDGEAGGAFGGLAGFQTLFTLFALFDFALDGEAAGIERGGGDGRVGAVAGDAGAGPAIDEVVVLPCADGAGGCGGVDGFALEDGGRRGVAGERDGRLLFATHGQNDQACRGQNETNRLETTHFHFLSSSAKLAKPC